MDVRYWMESNWKVLAAVIVVAGAAYFLIGRGSVTTDCRTNGCPTDQACRITQCATQFCTALGNCNCPYFCTTKSSLSDTIPPLSVVRRGCTGSDITKTLEVNVQDVLNSTGYNRLGISNMYIIVDGSLQTIEASSASASTLVKVPCEASDYRIVAYDNDYVVPEMYLVDLNITEQVLSGTGRIPITIPGEQMGTINTTLYEQGETQADDSIAIGAGEENDNIRLVVRETEDGKAARNIACLFKYDQQCMMNFQVLDTDGNIMEDLGWMPQIHSNYSKALAMTYKGEPLNLDGDPRTDTPDRVTYKVRIVNNPGCDPAFTMTALCMDSEMVLDTDGANYVAPVPLTDILYLNLGIYDDYEGSYDMTVT